MKMRLACIAASLVGVTFPAHAVEPVVNLGSLSSSDKLFDGSSADFVYENEHPGGQILSTDKALPNGHVAVQSAIAPYTIYYYQFSFNFTTSTADSLMVYAETQEGEPAQFGGPVQYINLFNGTELVAAATAPRDYPPDEFTSLITLSALLSPGIDYRLDIGGTNEVEGDGVGFADVQGNIDTSAFATAVPEPASWELMMLGLGGVGAALRNRRRERPVR